MRGGRKAVCRLGVLGLLLLCCFLAKAAAAGTEKYSEGVSVRKTKGTWSPAEADSIRQEESEQEFPDSCIFWGERGEEVLENEKLNRMEQASVIEVLGDTQGLLVATAPLYEEDEDGCLLSEDLACRLFGSKYVMGEEISYRGRTLTVRGILRGMEGTIWGSRKGQGRLRRSMGLITGRRFLPYTGKGVMGGLWGRDLKI